MPTALCSHLPGEPYANKRAENQEQRSKNAGNRAAVGVDKKPMGGRKGDNIAERLLCFGAQVVKVTRTFSKDVAGRHISRQLIRCGTAGGALYEEARSAESRADFVHKVKVAAKETRESMYWLRLAQRANLTPQRLAPEALLEEANQLVAILTSSANTANSRK